MLSNKTIDNVTTAISPGQIEGMLDFQTIFGRKAPVEMEVGSGKGTFLVEQAKRFPDADFWGIEWANKYYKYAVDRMGRQGITNVRLVRDDAPVFIRKHVPDGSLRMFHLYFPDPWPKKRHHRRRFFSDEILAQIYRILEPGGIVNVATDHENYFEQMTQVAANAVQQERFEEIPFIRPAGAKEGEIVGTNYERKYMKEGRRTYTLALRKKMNRETIDLNPLQALLEEHRGTFGMLEEMLITENQKFNLTRLTSPRQVRTRHFLDSLAGLGVMDALAKKLEKPLRVIDVGSGAGFPVLAIAIVRPQWSFVSVDGTEKKVLFQKEACRTLKLKNVQVLHGRAEEMAHQPPFREKFDVVTARALADLSILAELTLAFIRGGGMGLFWKGSAVAEELANAQPALRQMGGDVEQLASYTLLTENEPPANFAIVVCKKNRPTPKAYPRVFGVIKKNPLK